MRWQQFPFAIALVAAACGGNGQSPAPVASPSPSSQPPDLPESLRTKLTASIDSAQGQNIEGLGSYFEVEPPEPRSVLPEFFQLGKRRGCSPTEPTDGTIKFECADHKMLQIFEKDHKIEFHSAFTRVKECRAIWLAFLNGK
jgi:hypothetical protein